MNERPLYNIYETFSLLHHEKSNILECFFKKAFAPMWNSIVPCLCVPKSITSFNFENVKCKIPTKIAQKMGQKLSCLISHYIELPKEPS